MNLDMKKIEELCRQGLNQCEIAKAIGVSSSTVQREMKKADIHSRSYKRWSDEEINYLEEYYGVYNLKRLAKELNRSEGCIRAKINKMRLGPATKANGRMQPPELAEAIGVDRTTIINWIKDRGLKATQKVLTKERKFYLISIDDFWRWAKNNSERIRWDKFTEKSLGKEPKWVKEKRRQYDYRLKVRDKWTEEEDRLLRMYWKAGKSVKEIGNIIHRTTESIVKRRKYLELDKRNIILNWTAKEIDMLMNMKSKGYTDEKVAEELGRGTGGVVWKRRQLESRR